MTDLHDPWLVAAWPGMGNVAVTAGGYLVESLGAKFVHEIPAANLFDIKHVEVKAGLARVGRRPRSMFFEWKDPKGIRDLLIFIGEAQPTTGGYGLCQKLLDYALQRGVTRVYTFAAMASQLHPTDDPRVFAVATDSHALKDLETADVEILAEGQIGGLNGVLLTVAAERDLPGVCLLGELPFFAAGVSNPKASKAVLEVTASLTGIDLDFTRIDRQAEAVEEGLLQLLDKMKEAARQQSETGEESFSVPEFVTDEDEEASPDGPSLDYAARQRIESMFEEAHHDRSKAFHLKEELDRLGVFRQYENRFLDLFKQGE